MKITEQITVTEQHIHLGEPQDPSACPIALALRDAHPEATDVQVYSNDAYLILKDGALLETDLPDEAQDFIHDLDYNGRRPVGPIGIELTWERTP